MMNSRIRPTVPRQTGVGRSAALSQPGGSARSTQSPSFSSPGSPKRAPAPRDRDSRDSTNSAQANRQGPPSNGRQVSSTNTNSGRGSAYEEEDPVSSQGQRWSGSPSQGLPVSRSGQELATRPGPEEERGLFTVIEHLATLEAALYSILDGLKSNATYVSYFCREYWGTSAGQAQLALEKLSWGERLKRQVQQACVLESLSLGVASHLCSGTMQDVSVTILSRLRNLLYYIHENCLVLMDLVCQRWLQENPQGNIEAEKAGHCPENLNLDILLRTNRYRQLRKGEHVMALRQHNEMIANVVRQLCRGAALRRPPPSSRSRGATSPSPGDRSPGLRSASSRNSSSASNKALQNNILAVVNDVLAARTPLDRLRASAIRARMLQYLCFRPLLNDGSDPDCLWPEQDPYDRYGADTFSLDGPTIWFEPLPPMLCNLKQNPKLPPQPSSEVYTLVLDLDETLVHYFELNGMGSYGTRPGMHEFLQRMSAIGYELVIFTAATQDYADWVIDQIDPDHLIHHRLYRQHALPWGPLFAKDLSRLGRDLDRCLIVDNVQENFMLQPNNGIFIQTWYDDPHDTALFTLTPLLEELVQTRARVPDFLDKYREQIPAWAGFDQMGGEYAEYEAPDDGYGMLPAAPAQQEIFPAQMERPAPQQDFQQPQQLQQPLRSELPARVQGATAMYAQPRQEAPAYSSPAQSQPQQLSQQPQSQYEAPTQYVTGYAQPQQAQANQQPQYQLQAQRAGGYPQPQAAASAGPPQRAGPPAQPSRSEQPQPQPKAAPKFSAVSGAYQAQQPQAVQQQQQQQAQQPGMAQAGRPGSAALWGRPGLGSHQYVPPRQ